MLAPGRTALTLGRTAPGKTVLAPGRTTAAPGRTALARGRTMLTPGRSRSLREDYARSGEDCGRPLLLSPQSAPQCHSTALSLPLIVNSHPARGHRPLLTFPGSLLHASFFPPRSASQTIGRTPPQGHLPSGPAPSCTAGLSKPVPTTSLLPSSRTSGHFCYPRCCYCCC